jgi:hypothetical protein
MPGIESPGNQAILIGSMLNVNAPDKSPVGKLPPIQDAPKTHDPHSAKAPNETKE